MSSELRTRYKFSSEINLSLNKLIELDNWHAILALVYDYGVIAIAIALYFISPYFYPLTVIIIASRQGALSNLLHEAAHSRLMKNKKISYFIATYLSGYLILQEYYTFIDSHIRGHHKHLGHKENDPDYSFHIQEKLYENKLRSTFIKQYILRPLFLKNIPAYIKHIFIERAPTLTKNKKYALRMYLYLLTLTITFGYFNLLYYVVLFWIIPFFTVFQIIGWFIDLSEHYPIVDENRIDIQMTRNRFSHFLEDFIFNVHDENFHLVHHLRPAIPFWNLKKAHQVLLRDKIYRRLNLRMGGIFLSSNGQPSLIKNITLNNKRLFDHELLKSLR